MHLVFRLWLPQRLAALQLGVLCLRHLTHAYACFMLADNWDLGSSGINHMFPVQTAAMYEEIVQNMVQEQTLNNHSIISTFNQRYCNLIEHPWAKFASAPYLYGLFGSIWYHLFTQRGDAFVLFSDAIKHIQRISGQIPEKLCLNLLSTPTRKSLSLLVIHKKRFSPFKVQCVCRMQSLSWTRERQNRGHE